MIKNRFSWILAFVAVGACVADERPAGWQGVLEFEERDLSFELPGRVISRPVRRGQRVAANELLATIDDDLAKTAVAGREAEAQVAQARADLVGAGSRVEEIGVIEAQLRAASAAEQLAATNLARDRGLLAKGAIARAILDESEARAKTAVAERQALGQRLRELRSGARKEELAGARAQAAAAAAAARLEVQRAENYQLRALQAGEVLEVHVEPGEVVGTGTPVVTVADTAHPYVDVFVRQQDLAGIRVGAVASVRVDATERAFGGVVEDVGRRTEFTPRFLFSARERANLVIRVRVRVDDPERQLHAGVPTFVTIVGPS